MLGDILKIIGEDVFYYTKEGVTSSIEESIEQLRMEMKEGFRKYSMKTQKMMVDTAVIIVLIALGLYYVLEGFVDIIETFTLYYTQIAGLGAIIVGAVFLVIAIQIYKKSQRELERV